MLANRYRIVALLGRGGMGEVYRADDLTIGQQVALKFPPEAVASNPEAAARFRSEIRVARQVSHPNVCRVYDAGEVEGHLFLSMEYVDGEDLASLLRRIGRLPADKAVDIARQLCAGLAAAHQKGVLHRDLKPGNVMLDGRGQVLLTDFGLAGIAGEIEGNEVRSGTPAYMAPEQLAGKEVTIRSDIYSLGLVLYEIFTGKRPFEASTIAELVRLRSETTPLSISKLVRDLDPVVERVILRCLDAEPSRRPASALAVAAALPGGDPLAAALAAGETPSPEMVAAAGEGAGLRPAVAVPLFLAVIAGLAVSYVLTNRSSALEKIGPELGPEVLSQRARDTIRAAGGNASAVDHADNFYWDGDYVKYLERTGKLRPHWDEEMRQRPSALRFWYRESPDTLTALEFHDDMLTPGIVQSDDPPPIVSGMAQVVLDAQGRLLNYERIPAQRQAPGQPDEATVDWKPLFAAAGLDAAKFQTADPLWTFLGASDARFAWTGAWPGTTRPLRVEAAALRGKPVAFSLTGDWTKPDRMVSSESSTNDDVLAGVLLAMVVIVCLGAALLARRNLTRGQGDRRGAIRLAFFLFSVHMALWVFRVHLVASLGIAAMFLIALCTSLFFAVLVWTLYIAVEPYVRRRWPHSIIAWSSVLSGRIRDPIVGRDVLFGAALGLIWMLVDHALMAWSGSAPTLTPVDALLGVRGALGALLRQLASAVMNVLIFFFLLFLLRVLLRKQWLAATVFAIVFGALGALSSPEHMAASAAASVLIFGLVAVAVLRYGFLMLGVAFFVLSVVEAAPVPLNASVWYFGNAVLLQAIVVALAAWGFYASTAGQRFWKADLLD